MAKQLDEETILNELHGESAFFRPSPTPARDSTPQRVRVTNRRKEVVQTGAKKEAVQALAKVNGQNAGQPVDHAVDHSAHQAFVHLADSPDNESTEPRANQLADQSIDEQSSRKPTTGVFDMSLILPKPKAFYITEKQNEDLDILVKKLAEKLKGKVAQKMDRSVATRLIFESVGLTSDKTAEQLANLLIGRLASQLAGQQAD